MKNLFPFIFFLLGFQLINAQVEHLSPLNYNPSIYYQRAKTMPSANTLKYLVDSGYTIVNTDTLQLPFVDDFSVDRTPNYLWRSQHITATYLNVVAGCLGTEGFNVTQGAFITTPSYTYSWNYANRSVDSVQQNAIPFTIFSNASTNCFSGTPTTISYWPAYSRPTAWDSATGYPTDSVLVGTPDTLTYAPVVNVASSQPGTLWFDNYALINNTYPINPPTIGVATLDGLNQYGLPYNNTSTSAYGTADYLTSKPIDLSHNAESDSVYLSFFFEAQGNGDYPDTYDSLIVEFKDQGGAWNMVWADTGYSYQPWVPDSFAQVLIKVPTYSATAPYYYSTFQFRFRNKASLFGNNNHWHIDYVKLNKNRSYTDSVIRDQAFVYPLPTILKNYTQESVKQFIFPTDLSDSIPVLVHNLNPAAISNPPATDFTKKAVETYPTPGTIAGNTVTFNAGPSVYNEVIPLVEYHIPATFTDSLVINSEAFISTNDVLQQNDTIRHNQTFGSVMAYDDGTAEKAYGLTGLDLKKFAYEFDLNKPDTLMAFQVMFAQVEGNVHDLVFNFQAWDSLRLNDYTFTDHPIFNLINQTPYYVDSANGFTTYVLDTPLIIPRKFYFGWSQVDQRRLQIGYDVNSTLGRNHMFIYTEAVWDSSTISIPGSPMIRLVLGSNYWGRSSNTVGVTNLTQDNNTLEVFPNPSSGRIHLQSSFAYNTLEVVITNSIGEVVKQLPVTNNEIDIHELANGIYLLNATDLQTGKTYHAKVVKASL